MRPRNRNSRVTRAAWLGLACLAGCGSREPTKGIMQSGQALTRVTIQGSMIDESGNPFYGSTISISVPKTNPTAAHPEGDRYWYGMSFTNTNTYSESDLVAGTTYEVGAFVPDGYAAYYSAAINSVAHPAESFHPYGGDFAPPV